MLGKKTIFIKIKKIKKKGFKKNVFLIKTINKIKNFRGVHTSFFYIVDIFKKYYKYNYNNMFDYNKKGNLPFFSKNIFISISQKKFSPKAAISSSACLNTFSIGSIIKYFKVKQGKYIRRSSKGVRVFLNFLKNIFGKKYNNTKSNKNIIFSIIGFDYSLMFLKKTLKSFLKKNMNGKSFFLFNLKISFTKLKGKKIKSIKKRLRKKILLSFSKSIRLNNK